MSLEPKKLTVNGREYMLTMMDPMTVLDFIGEAQEVHADKEKFSSVMRKAIGYCRTPDMGKALSDTVVFQEHFAKHPEDMLELGKKAIEELTAPFTGKQSSTRGTKKS